MWDKDMKMFKKLFQRPYRPWQISLFTCSFLLLAGGVFALSEYLARQTPPSVYPGLDEVGFTLTDHTGQQVTSAALTDKPNAIYFGFTYCPDICPTTLSLISGQLAELGLTDDIRLILITVDPVRDTVEQLSDYLTLFEAPILGLTGSEADIDALIAELGIFRAEVDDGYGTTTIDHTSSVFLFHKGGAFKGTISPVEPNQFIQQKLAALVP